MHTSPTRVRWTGFLVALILAPLGLASTVLAQTATSAAPAKELAQAMDAAKLDAIAAADPADPSTFVAALYLQGSQILAVSAKYAAPPLLLEKIKNKNYRDVYIDLNSASEAGTKVFVIDTGIDGLTAKPEDGAADSVEMGSRQITFDGEWKDAKMSEEEYMKAYTEADAQYAKILSLLLSQVKAPAATTGL
jgi:hypothetical protein